MKGNELVWRALADESFAGSRTWDNVADIGFSAGVPTTTAYLALDRLESIGAVRRYSRGGLSVTSVDKILTVLCARRNLVRDTLVTTTLDGVAPLLETSRGPYALGGPDAANALLGGHPLAGFREHVVYLPPSQDLTKLPPGDEVRVLVMDPRASKTWNGYSSISQTYADLFATPGWAASEYRLALRERFLREREWDQEDDSGNG